MPWYYVFALGCAGGLLPDILRVVAVRHGEAPSYLWRPFFWISLSILSILGGLAAVFIGSGGTVEALAIGYGAPSIISRLLADKNPDPSVTKKLPNKRRRELTDNSLVSKAATAEALLLIERIKVEKLRESLRSLNEEGRMTIKEGRVAAKEERKTENQGGSSGNRPRAFRIPRSESEDFTSPAASAQVRTVEEPFELAEAAPALRPTSAQNSMWELFKEPGAFDVRAWWAK